MRLPARWWHGDTNPRLRFEDQVWDRDRSVASANENGPGLYFTSSREQAEAYGPYLFRAGVRLGTRLLRPNKKPTLRALMCLWNHANEDDKELFLTNWGLESSASPAPVLAKYVRQNSLFDALVSLYLDLIRDPSEWVLAMRACGHDGAVVPRAYGVLHLVVYNPSKFLIEREQ